MATVRRVARSTPAPGYVALYCDDPPLALTALIGASSPKVTGGVGGWETVARPRQTAMTVWDGVDPFELELELMLDGYAAGVSQEPALRALYAVAGGDPESPPGILEVRGIPSLPANRWVIDTIEEDSDGVIRRTSDFSRVRCPLTLALREYVPATYLQLRKSALKGAKGKTKVLTVRKGDTPASIARRQACTWTDLRDLNPGVVKKANQDLKDASKIRVPVAKSRDRRDRGAVRSRKSTTTKRSS